MTDLVWTGGRGGDRAFCVLAPNPSPMTLEGTNTWILLEPGAERAVVVDPGPLDDQHLDRVVQSVAAAGARVGEVLLTHGHADHSEGAAEFAARCQTRWGQATRVRALDPAYRLGDEGLGEGDVVATGGLEVRVVATPGHTADSLSFLVEGEGLLLTGDTVLGRGTTVVAWPDGQLAAYLDSLGRLRDLASGGSVSRILPGHGPLLDRPLEVLERYLTHRAERLEQVRAAVAAGARSPRAVVEQVYADVDRALWPAAEMSVRAQLEFLGVPTDEAPAGDGPS